METDRLPRLLLELREQVRGLFLQLRQDCAIAVVHEVARRMPGRAGGELVLLDQHDIRPTELREVVRETAAGHAAADDQDTRMRLHNFGSL